MFLSTAPVPADVVSHTPDRVCPSFAHAAGRVQLVGLGIIPQHFHNAAAHIMQTGDVICINYFDEAGIEALKEYWLAHILDDEALNAKIQAGDVQLFKLFYAYKNTNNEK